LEVFLNFLHFHRTGARDGLIALWLLKRDAKGHLGETYPWMRLPPKNWFDLPDLERQQVFTIIQHVATPPVSGLALHILLLPDRQLSAVQVFVCVSNSLETPIVIPISRKLSSSMLHLVGPSKDTTISLLDPKYADDSAIAPLVVPARQKMCLPTSLYDSYQSAQITIKEQPLIGKYTIRATLDVTNRNNSGLFREDSQPPQGAKIWQGALTAELSTTINK